MSSRTKTPDAETELEKRRIEDARESKRVDVALEVIRMGVGIDAPFDDSEDWQRRDRRSIGESLLRAAERVLEKFLGDDDAN